MAEQNAYVFKILIGQISERCNAYTIVGKALRVLGHAELLKPVRDLLHRRPRADLPATTRAESLAILPSTL